MLYIFVGFPGKDALPGSKALHAGGLQYAIEERLGIALLEHGDVHYRKGGVYSGDTPEAEELYPIEYRLSDSCLRDGLTWDWFPKNWAFGDGVTVHKTSAYYEERVVVHGTEEMLNEYLSRAGVVRLSDIELEKKHIRTESWAEYERRWLPGTCPQENHVVHLTWVVTKHRLPEFAYKRLQQLIEGPGGTVDESLYGPEHFSITRVYDGMPTTHTVVR